MKQIDAMSNNIAHIKQSIADKEGYLALAHIRIEHRCQRPETELTQDLVEANLVKEVHELRNIVANLQQTLYEVRNSCFVSQNYIMIQILTFLFSLSLSIF